MVHICRDEYREGSQRGTRRFNMKVKARRMHQEPRTKNQEGREELRKRTRSTLWRLRPTASSLISKEKKRTEEKDRNWGKEPEELRISWHQKPTFQIKREEENRNGLYLSPCLKLGQGGEGRKRRRRRKNIRLGLSLWFGILQTFTDSEM